MRKILKKYFIPHEDNSFRPYFWVEYNVLAVCSLILVLFLIFSFQSIFLIRTNYFTAAVLPHVLVDLTNEARVKSGLAPLKVSQKLEKAAQSKANDMAKNGYFAHQSPEGLAPWYWFSKAGYVFDVAGENLAADFSDSVEVNKAWLNSPKHRYNILNPRFSEIGIATIRGFYKERETVLVVQIFGRPRSISALPVASIGIDRQASYWMRIAASPMLLLNFSYWILGFIIFAALLLDSFIEIKKKHPRHIVYGVSLIVLMTVLAYFGHEYFIATTILV